MGLKDRYRRVRSFLTPGNVLGIVIGIALGLLALSVLVLLLRVTIIYFVVFSLGLIVIFPIVYGIRTGLKFVDKRVQKEPTWPTLVLLAIVLWPTAIVLPFGVQYLRLYVAVTSEIPVYPLAQDQRIFVELGDFENTGDRAHLFFTTMSDESTVLKFYRDEFLQRGWRPGPEHLIEMEFQGTRHWFRHETSGKPIHMYIEPGSVDGQLQIDIVFGI